MTRTLASRSLELLGPIEGRVAVLGARPRRLASALGACVPLAGPGETASAAVITFLGASAVPAERQAVLASLGGQLDGGAPVVLVDHNQPRSWWRRALGVATLALRGLAPARARYPAARELAALGLEVERLRLARGERVQLVAARWRPRTCVDGVELVVPPGEQVEGAERGRWR